MTSSFLQMGCLSGGMQAKGIFKTSSEKNPLISFITVVLNGHSLIEDTIKSVLSQSYKNIEYIVVDGGSTDGTLDVIRKYDESIDCWISRKDSGIYDAMNTGFTLSRGEWVVFLNAGDRILLLHENSVISAKTTSTCYCYYEESLKISRNPLTKFFLCRNNPCHQSVFYKRSEFQKYSFQFPVIADFEQLSRLCTRTLAPEFNNSLVFYKKPGFSQEYTKKKTLRKLWIRANIIRRNMGFIFFLISLFHSVRILFFEIIAENINEHQL